ncbi:hypothetical protein ACLFLC_05685 [Providencia rettgeri]
MFDWELDEPNDGLIFYYAQLAAKLVISGYIEIVLCKESKL